MNWLEEARNLPLGHKTRLEHNCGSGRTLIVNHSLQGYSSYCFRCGEQEFESKGKQSLQELTRIRELNAQAAQEIKSIELPEDLTEDIPLEGRMWLYKAGLTPSTWNEYGIRYSPSMGRVYLPVAREGVGLLWYQARAIYAGQTPKYIQPSAERSTVLFESKPLRDSTRVVVLVEDIVSAIRVGEVAPAISLLGTKITTGQASYISKYDRVVIWLDSDKAGRVGAANIRRTLSLLTETANICTTDDPKLLTRQQITEKLKEFL